MDVPKVITDAINDQATPQINDQRPDAHTTPGRILSGYECERCSDTGFEFIVRDGSSGVRRCACVLAKEQARTLALIPPQFHSPRLATIDPRHELHGRQAAIIEGLRARPRESYLLVGTNGVGKTHLAWALFADNVTAGNKGVASKLAELLTEYRRFELQRSDDPENTWRPRILSEDLKQTTRKWTIFLDELEKARPTEFAAERLFALLDAAQEYGHQLIFTSNLTEQELQQAWNRIKIDGRYEDNKVWGNSIARRIAQVCTVVEMF